MTGKLFSSSAHLLFAVVAEDKEILNKSLFAEENYDAQISHFYMDNYIGVISRL